jgi:ABC-type oligopeptide transport system substrate-binding subunit
MKNIIKLSLIAFIALSFAACKGTHSTSTTDTTKVVDSTKTTVVDTAKKDTAKMKTDTTKKP